MTRRRCCCDDCGIFADAFGRDDSSDLGDDWTEVSGNSSIVSNVLSVPAGGLVTCDTDHPLPHYISVKCQIAVGEEGRVIVNYADADNYHFVALTRSATPDTYYLKIYHRSGGSDSFLFGDSVPCGDDGYALLLVCTVASTGFIGAIGEIGSDYLTSEVAGETITQTTVGLGAASAGPVEFDDFQSQRHYSDTDPNCPGCAALCNHCDTGTTSTHVQVVVPVSDGGNWCTDAECAVLAGTYILPQCRGVANWCAYRLFGSFGCGLDLIGFEYESPLTGQPTAFFHNNANEPCVAGYTTPPVYAYTSVFPGSDCVADFQELDLDVLSGNGCDNTGDPWVVTALQLY